MKICFRSLLLLLVTLSVGAVCVSAQKKCTGDDFECRIKADPKDAEAYYIRAFVISESGKFEQAIADLTRYFELTTVATDNKKDVAGGYHLRGQLHEATRNFEQALADYAKAIELDPADARFYISRARYYIWDHKKSKARPDVLKAVELTPKDPAVYELMADTETDYEKELADRSKYISMLGTDDKVKLSQALNSRAHTYMNLKQHELAEADLTRAIGLTPNNKDLYLARSIIYNVLRKYDLAAADSKKFESLP